jgi:hypothetical protein
MPPVVTPPIVTPPPVTTPPVRHRYGDDGNHRRSGSGSTGGYRSGGERDD